MKDQLSKAEIRKDAVQDGVEAAAQAVGQATTIVVDAVTGIVKTVGGLATDLFEIRDAARRALADAELEPAVPAAVSPDVPELTAVDELSEPVVEQVFDLDGDASR